MIVWEGMDSLYRLLRINTPWHSNLARQVERSVTLVHTICTTDTTLGYDETIKRLLHDSI